ncbi:MAG: hypothetical protein FJX67_04740 [Alphaproteobacteria bacterium]|nr:hypothetical protein [Alphaproteobacteria bacterium]
MTRLGRLALALGFAATPLLAACDRYTLTETAPVTMADAYVVDPRIAWNRRSQGRTEIWTVDGPMLQELRFVNGLEDGEVLFGGTDAKKLPPFSPRMTAIEVVEFFALSFTRAGVTNFEHRALRPTAFAGRGGFRFEFAYSLEDGLAREGFAVGAVRDSRLYLVVYSGTQLHFFAKHKADAEAVVASIRPRGGPAP